MHFIPEENDDVILISTVENNAQSDVESDTESNTETHVQSDVESDTESNTESDTESDAESDTSTFDFDGGDLFPYINVILGSVVLALLVRFIAY